MCNGMPATATFYITPNVIGQIPVEGMTLYQSVSSSYCTSKAVVIFEIVEYFGSCIFWTIAIKYMKVAFNYTENTCVMSNFTTMLLF